MGSLQVVPLPSNLGSELNVLIQPAETLFCKELLTLFSFASGNSCEKNSLSSKLNAYSSTVLLARMFDLHFLQRDTS